METVLCDRLLPPSSASTNRGPMPDDAFRPADPAQAQDLSTLVSRARAVDAGAAVRLQARGRVLAVWVPVMSGETLLDQVPTVLGMRAIHLADPAEFDVVVEASAVLDRLARFRRPETEEQSGEGQDARIPLPPVTVQASWTGTMPGRSGWTRLADVPAEELAQTARDGMAAVENALPAQAGAAVLSTVRSRIWGTVQDRGYVAGAAFGAEVLGFNTSPQGAAAVAHWANGPWHRLSTPAGHVLARPASAL